MHSAVPLLTLYLPGEQGRHIEAPVVALPVAYPAGQIEQEVEAETLLKYPLSHAVHSVVPLLTLYLPGEQGRHIKAPVVALPVAYPAGQGEQEVEEVDASVIVEYPP